MKVCSKCGTKKSLSEFSKQVGHKDGIRNQCKECDHAQNQRWLQEHKEDRIIYFAENKARRNATSKAWNDLNRDRVNKTTREWNKANALRTTETKRAWAIANPDKVRQINKKSNAKRLSIPINKVSNAIRCRMWSSLKRGLKANRHWEELAGYTIDQLQRHLEKQFDENMTWGNYGAYWHVDHIIPISAFNFSRPEDIDFRRCWALQNLRPLEARENLRKHSKLEQPFQPSLAMGMR
jgi:hypothetical protein